MKRVYYGLLGAAAGIMVLGAPAQAAVKPHGLFSDGAVLQQGMAVPVWGTADNGEKVTVSIQGQTAATTAENGKWMVKLRPLKAGGPFTLKIAGPHNNADVNNVLVGEVWIASGQSNMEMGIANTANAQEAIAQSGDPQLRLMTIPKATSKTPEHEVTAKWQEATPSTVGTGGWASFSAVAYYFARDLRRALKVPVGVIHTSWGGTVAEAWTRHGTLESDPTLQKMLATYDRQKYTYPQALVNYQRQLDQYQAAVAQGRGAGLRQPQPPAAPDDPRNPNRPSVLYNAMIAPLVPYAIKGAIWYQGESNAGRAWEYQTLFPTMIQDWRSAWGEGDFPFLFVQLAPFMAIQKQPTESAWAELREAQRLTTLRVPKAGMAVITDVGEEQDIHPKQKQPVGSRLALAALHIGYGKSNEFTGPTYDSLKIEGTKAVVRFKHAEGLTAKGGALTGFTVAGEDKVWHNADAKVEGDHVVVSSAEVAHPAAVRFGWWNFPVVNLWNSAGLPASPFRTDNWTLTTAPK